ncbi:MAG TPA: hypothetical protein PLA19_00300 [Candidatus Pacearchaeota archaeon]|nr:hypothetical protein [Candidatus Pacearchaeota archaeon]
MEDKITSIEVIGSGCANCKKLHELAVLAAKELNLGVGVACSDARRGLKFGEKGVMVYSVKTVRKRKMVGFPLCVNSTKK